MEALIYLAKSTAILSLFFLVYEFFLKKETYFNANRIFLLLGIFVAAILPAYTYIIIIEIEPVVGKLVAMPASGNSTVESTAQTGFVAFLSGLNYTEILLFIYIAGIAFLLSKFVLSIVKLKVQLKRTGTVEYRNGIRYVRTTMKTSPFAYFNTIVFNPKMHKEHEIDTILKHEEAHVNNYHSIDVVLGYLVTSLHWFNPFVWIYRKRMSENLEYLADMEATKGTDDIKAYQYALLNTVAPQVNPILPVNSFQGSFIKKRIMMMQKKSSSKAAMIKLAIILPVLILFFIGFQTESRAVVPENFLNAQSPGKDSTYIKRIDNETLAIRIAPGTSLETLSLFKRILKNTYKIDFIYKDVRYSKDDVITHINLEVIGGMKNGKKDKILLNQKGDKGEVIKPITFSVHYDIVNGAGDGESRYNADGELYIQEMTLFIDKTKKEYLNVDKEKSDENLFSYSKRIVTDSFGNSDTVITKYLFLEEPRDTFIILDLESMLEDTFIIQPSEKEPPLDIILIHDKRSGKTDTFIEPQPKRKTVTDTILIKDPETGKTDTMVLRSEPIKKPVNDTIVMMNPDTGKMDTIVIRNK